MKQTKRWGDNPMGTLIAFGLNGPKAPATCEMKRGQSENQPFTSGRADALPDSTEQRLLEH
jgi:hypothetical protein